MRLKLLILSLFTSFLFAACNKDEEITFDPNAKLNFELLTILSKEYNNNSLLEDGGSPKPVEEVKTTSAGNSDILYFRQQAKVEE